MANTDNTTAVSAITTRRDFLASVAPLMAGAALTGGGIKVPQAVTSGQAAPIESPLEDLMAQRAAVLDEQARFSSEIGMDALNAEREDLRKAWLIDCERARALSAFSVTTFERSAASAAAGEARRRLDEWDENHAAMFTHGDHFHETQYDLLIQIEAAPVASLDEFARKVEYLASENFSDCFSMVDFLDFMMLHARDLGIKFAPAPATAMLTRERASWGKA